MQTVCRKIPFPDGQLYCRWEQCLPEYEKEYGNFKRNIQRIRDGNLTIEHKTDAEKAKPLKQADFKVLSEGCETYPVRKESLVFTDKEYKIRDVIPELDGLTGIRFRSDMAETRGISLKMGLKEDSQILIGYMQAKGTQWLQVPDLEIDTHADDRGGLEIKFENAVRINGCPSVNVHAFQYERGIHELYFGTGSYLVVGVIPKGIKLQQKNGSLLEENPETLDWLYGSLPI
jgi:hypothetical protein